MGRQMMNIVDIVQAQRDFFNSQGTKKVAFRIAALKHLQSAIQKNQPKIFAALKADLNKSEFEAYMTEVGLVLDETRFMIQNTAKWSRKKHRATPPAILPASSYEIAEPYGVTLIMSPWNYPFQLSMEPLVGAIAAGNCVVLKPSAYAPETSRVLAEMLAEIFPPEYVTVVQGGRKENQDLLKQRFDYIFFTGSVTVGKLVMESAAQYLTPVTLELGGKSPCIVDPSANLKIAAKRIAFGKLINAGQTCVAPDYLFVHKSIKEPLVAAIKEEITSFYGADPMQAEHYPKIINQKQFDRLTGLLEGQKVLLGGVTNERMQIAPTLLDDVDPASPVMNEEIFGPILPVMTYEDIDDVIDFITDREKPLALYLFTEEAAIEKKVLNAISFGGGCINDTLVHVATSKMGFGGVGQSGMGRYHGKYSFETFSHIKSIVKNPTWIDVFLRYLPPTETKRKLLNWFLH
jgi:aldehyde dehydrogenase (NAD+)